MSLEALRDAAATHALRIAGTCRAEPADGLGSGTIVLLSPDEPGFWETFTASAEYRDGHPNPMDRWSTRAVTAIASDVGGSPLLPFGQPSRPFLTWALRSGEIWASPVGLLVHLTDGLLVSFRGAVLIQTPVDRDAADKSPCESCDDKPCLSACPVGALTGGGYDLTACHAYLDTSDGTSCLLQGCAVRMACPLTQSVGRVPAQSAFHMKAFHPGKG